MRGWRLEAQVVLKIFDEFICFVFGIIDKLKNHFFHRQIERTEMPNRLIMNSDLDFPVAIVNDHPMTDYLVGTIFTSGWQISQECRMSSLHFIFPDRIHSHVPS